VWKERGSEALFYSPLPGRGETAEVRVGLWEKLGCRTGLKRPDADAHEGDAPWLFGDPLKKPAIGRYLNYSWGEGGVAVSNDQRTGTLKQKGKDSSPPRKKKKR